MAIRGERFEIDLDSSDEEVPLNQSSSIKPPFIRDILEKENDSILPPTPPKLKSTQDGFPQPRPRKGPSRFKQEKKQENHIRQSHKQSLNFEDSEKKRIDEENRQRLQEMSPEEIEQERKELLAGLSGSLIERLLKRSNIEEASDDFDKPLREAPQATPKTTTTQHEQKNNADKETKSVPAKEKRKVTFAENDDKMDASHDSDGAGGLASSASQSDTPQQPNIRLIHFPKAPAPSLDPSSSTFLQDLHQKYFPTLPYDPESLAWMTPLPPDIATDPVSYSPAATSFSPAELRFDFSGNLLPPNLAHQIPTTKGLHHHGLAPEAAGYTIDELSIYARSTVQAQRCMAFQTLGRFLFKLGTGVFGDDGGPEGDIIDEEDDGAVLCRGLWNEVVKERILDTLVEEAGKDEGLVRHRSAHALAVEAVWLWRRGGGRWPGKQQDSGAAVPPVT